MNLVRVSVVAALVFFSISFLSFLFDLAPLNKYFVKDSIHDIDVGWPFNYYYQFYIGGNTGPDFSWNVPALLTDIILTWLCTLSAVYYLRRLNPSCQDKSSSTSQ